MPSGANLITANRIGRRMQASRTNRASGLRNIAIAKLIQKV